jgi:hypothetical protein
MITPSIDTIERILVAGLLDESEARRRAPLILEDFNWIGFDSLMLDARPCQAIEQYLGSSFRIPEYHFGYTGHSIDAAEQAAMIKVEWMGGTGLDRGHLQFFSRVSEIGRKLIPHFWHKPCRLRDSLRNPSQHLDTIEEVWWLDRWKSTENIKSSVKLNPECASDVDWTFTLGGGAFSVNLEVKRLNSDCLRHVRGRTFKMEHFDRFCKSKVNRKFRKSEESEVNVLAITLFGEICREVQLVIEEWLISQDLIDAVIITSRESRQSRCFDWHFRNEKAQGLRVFLEEPTEEDQSLVFGLIVPIEILGIPSIVKS